MKTTLKSLEKNLLDLKKDLSKDYGDIIKRLENLEKETTLLKSENTSRIVNVCKVEDRIEKLEISNKQDFSELYERVEELEMQSGVIHACLLTQEEKEYLQKFIDLIKPYKIIKISSREDIYNNKHLKLELARDEDKLPLLSFLPLKTNLELYKDYTLEELGI